MSFVRRVLLLFLSAALFTVMPPSDGEAADGRLRLGVARFSSKADGVSDSQAAIITDLFTFDLVQSKEISVMERESIDKIGNELKFDMSGLVDPMTAAEIGKVAGLQYMLLGAVTQVDQKASGGGFGVFVSASHEMRATIDMRIIDVATAEIKMALRAEGTSKNDSSGMSWGGFTHVETEFGGLEAKAIADAVSKLSANVRSALGGEYSYVVSVTSSGFALDVAASKAGSLYLVYLDGKTIYGLNGEEIGKDKIPLAILKVSDVNIGYSIASVVPKGGNPKNIQRGDKIEPISQSKAKELISKLPNERPRTASDAAETLLGGQAAKEPNPAAPGGAEADSGSQADAIPAVAEPVPAAAPSGSAKPKAKTIDGLDPNTSTDAKVIDTYPLSQGNRNMIGIQHRNAYKLYTARRYKDALEMFSKIAENYDCNYLSAYWAGMTSLKLKNKDKAAEWFNIALKINPDYQPASKELEKLRR